MIPQEGCGGRRNKQLRGSDVRRFSPAGSRRVPQGWLRLRPEPYAVRKVNDRPLPWEIKMNLTDALVLGLPLIFALSFVAWMDSDHHHYGMSRKRNQF
jgi:hypothetical protein